MVAIIFSAGLVVAQVGTAVAGVMKSPTVGGIRTNVIAQAPTGGSSGGCGMTGGQTGSGLTGSVQTISTQTGNGSTGGCNMTGGQSGSGATGGCGMMGGGSNSTAKSATLGEAEKAGIQYYKDQGGKDEVTAKATDFGCHVQVDILKNGAIIASYSYSGGNIY